MHASHDLIWFTISLLAGVGMLSIVLMDFWRPQVRGALARAGTRPWWRALMTCVAAGSLLMSWRAWSGDASLTGGAERIQAVVAILGVVCLAGLLLSLNRQQPTGGQY